MQLKDFKKMLDEATDPDPHNDQIVLIQYPINETWVSKDSVSKFATSHEIEVSTIPGFIFVTVARKKP